MPIPQEKRPTSNAHCLKVLLLLRRRKVLWGLKMSLRHCDHNVIKWNATGGCDKGLGGGVGLGGGSKGEVH